MQDHDSDQSTPRISNLDIRFPQEYDLEEDIREYLRREMRSWLSEDCEMGEHDDHRSEFGLTPAEAQYMVNKSTKNFAVLPGSMIVPEALIGRLLTYERSREEMGRFFEHAGRLGRFVEYTGLPGFDHRLAFLPFSSDFAYVMTGPLFHFARTRLNLQRLARIDQLGNIGLYTSPNLEKQGKISSDYDLRQNRLEHSVLVAALMEMTMTRLGATEQEIREGTMAGLLHDNATPALGDSMKHLDFQGLDEETHLLEMINDGIQSKMRYELGIDARGLSEIIRGIKPCMATSLMHSKGLDLDKMGYIGLDVFHLTSMCARAKELRRFGSEGRIESAENNELHSRLQSIIAKDPTLFDAHKTTTIDNGRLVWGEPGRVYNILLMRALMSEGIYYHPEKNAKEAYLTYLLSPFYNRGNLNADVLRKITDNDASFLFLSALTELDGGTSEDDTCVKLDDFASSQGIQMPSIIHSSEKDALRFFTPFYHGNCPYTVTRHSCEQEARATAPKDGWMGRLTQYRTYNKVSVGEKTLVLDGKKVMPLEQALSKDELDRLVGIRERIIGTYRFAPNPEYFGLFDEIEALHRKIRETGYTPPIKLTGRGISSTL